MRTSGKSGGDLFMMTVPFLILVVFGVMTGGGVKNVLHMAETTMWTAVEFVMAFFS
jgi:hypothetical protein